METTLRQDDTLAVVKLTAGSYVVNNRYYVERSASGWRWYDADDLSVGGEWRWTRREALKDVSAHLAVR